MKNTQVMTWVFFIFPQNQRRFEPRPERRFRPVALSPILLSPSHRPVILTFPLARINVNGLNTATTAPVFLPLPEGKIHHEINRHALWREWRLEAR
jgi:hypothetical protein